MHNFDEAQERIEQAAVDLRLEVKKNELQVYFVDPLQTLTPLAFSSTAERYTHWSFGKKAEIFNNWIRRGELNPATLDIFMPGTNPVGYILGDMPMEKQISAFARIYLLLDFARKSGVWQARNFDEAQLGLAEHARVIAKLTGEVGEVNVEKVLQAAHSVAYQCAHCRALGNRTSDFLTEVAAKSPKLDNWKREVLRIVHDEWVWLLPQLETLVMAKGYVAVGFMPLIEAAGINGDLWVKCLADLTNELAIPELAGSINPSNVGYEIFDRVFKNECGEDMARFLARAKEMIGARSDPAFIQEFLSLDSARNSGLLTWGQRGRSGEDAKILEVKELSDEAGWEKVRDELALWLGGNAFPAIRITQNNDRYFIMKHEFDGRTLDRSECENVLKDLHELLGVPVHLETVKIDDKGNRSTDTWRQPPYTTYSPSSYY